MEEEVLEPIRIVAPMEPGNFFPEAEYSAFDWKRPMFILGGLVVGAGVLGGLAGLSLKSNEAPAKAETAVVNAHPAQPHQAPSVQPNAPEVLPADIPSQPRARNFAISKPHHTISRKRRAPTREQQVATSQMAPNPLMDNKGDQAPSAQPTTEATQPAPETAQPTRTNLPLSRSVIARTINRIGRCGEVASTTAVDDQAPGVFRVTCSSGNSYRATPVSGRYHFRRVGS